MDYSLDIKDSRMNIVKTALDGGKLKIFTVGYAKQLVAIDLQNPSAYVSNGSLNILGVPLSGMAVEGGEASIAVFVNSSNDVVISNLSVGISNANIIIDNIAIVIGQTVNLLNGIIIHG